LPQLAAALHPQSFEAAKNVLPFADPVQSFG
jgi:hypothetical protein